MQHTITHLKDIFGSNYLGINIQKTEVQPFLNQLKDHLGDSCEEYVQNQQNRDGGSYHITLINTIDYNGLINRIGLDKFTTTIQNILKYPVTDLKFMGLGKAQRNDNVSYFVVVESEQLDSIVDHFGLPEKDFHVTLGFRHKDVHGVRKNEVMKMSNGFLKLLKSKYDKEGETFEFLKGLENFDGDFYKLIEPIKINDSNAILRVGSNYYQLSLIDGSIQISAKWTSDEDLPILSDTIVNKKLNS